MQPPLSFLSWLLANENEIFENSRWLIGGYQISSPG
jgi:hypothetical protein